VLSLLPAEFSRARPRSALGYSELMRGKAACHLVSPILWQSTLARSGRRHGMAMTGMLTATANLAEPLQFRDAAGIRSDVVRARQASDPS
jgi:hypothetical protein